MPIDSSKQYTSDWYHLQNRKDLLLIILFNFGALDHHFSSFVLGHVVDLLMRKTNLLLAVELVLNDEIVLRSCSTLLFFIFGDALVINH